ncbi:syncytin-A-like [Calonectris borealis]|uniref:syncytin-A-like n=1 Tax=Calonectris borealis TaxID=1323832 RepID=UPI003F4BE023
MRDLKVYLKGVYHNQSIQWESSSVSSVPSCPTPQGIWWLCGDGRARKSLPNYWSGICTLGYVIPQNRVYNHSHPPPGIIRTHWRKVREVPTNPLAERPTAFHSFVRWYFPQLGVRELERAIVNISATVEKIENLTTDAVLGLQTEVSSLSKVVLQNRMALDIIMAKEGGVCLVINQSCCSYIDQEQRIETDITRIWQQSRVLHEVTQDDTSLGLFELWKKLTSWLPNFTWLKQLFIAVIMLIILGVVVCCMLQCFMWMCKQTGNTYEERKRHRLRQKVEEGKYFTRTLDRNGII